MERLPIEVPSLHNGISTQPPHIRLANQVESSQNFIFSVRDGASKRPGTWVEQLIATGALETAGARLFPSARDENERYHILVGASTGVNFVRVLEDGFDEATVNATAAALAYLESGTPTRADFRVLTVGDTSFIVNTKVTVAAATSASYTVTGSHRDFDVMVSSTPTSATYHRADADGELSLRGHYYYDPGESSTFAKWTGPTVTGATWATPTGDYDASASNPGGFRIGFQRVDMNIAAGVYTHATRKLVDPALATYVFRAGDQLFVTGGTGNTAGWRDISGKTGAQEIQFTTNTGFTADNADTTSTAIGHEYAVEVELGNILMEDMYDVAAQFQKALRDAGAVDACVAWEFTTTEAGRFVITSPWRGSAATCFDPTAPTTGFDYTAVTTPFDTGTITAGTGSPTTDTYPVLSRWTRVVAPGQASATLDASTMPIILRRTSASVAPATVAVFSLDVADWGDRLSGDEVTNPVASFVGKQIRDLIYNRNRLWIGAGESLVMSQTDDVYNFWLNNAFNIVDSDPIDVTLASDQYTRIDFLVPVRGSVFIFTTAGRQFEIEPGVLAPGKVKAQLRSSYPTLSVRPVVIDPAIYFAVASEGAVQLYEWVVDDVEVPSRANNLNEHCASLVATRDTVDSTLTADLLTMVAAPRAGMVFLLMSIFHAKPPNVYSSVDIFTYRVFRDEQRRKLQSAWCQYVFDGFSGVDEHLLWDISIIDDRMYLLTTQQTTAGTRYWYLERMAITNEQPRDDAVATVIYP